MSVNGFHQKMVEPFRLPVSETTNADQSASMDHVKRPVQENQRTYIDSRLVTEEVTGRRMASSTQDKEKEVFLTLDQDELDVMLGKKVPDKAFEVEVVDSSCLPSVLTSVPSLRLRSVEEVDDDEPFEASTIKEEPLKEEFICDPGEHRCGSELSNKELQKIIPLLAMLMFGYTDRLKVGNLWKRAPDNLPADVIWRSPNSALKETRNGRTIIRAKPLQPELLQLYGYLIMNVLHECQCPCLIKLSPGKNKAKKETKGARQKVDSKTVKKEPRKRTRKSTPKGGKKMKIEEEVVTVKEEPQTNMMVYRNHNILSPMSSRLSESDLSVVTESDCKVSTDDDLKLDPAHEEYIADAIQDEDFLETFNKAVGVGWGPTVTPDLERFLNSANDGCSTDAVDATAPEQLAPESTGFHDLLRLTSDVDCLSNVDAGVEPSLIPELDDVMSVIQREMPVRQEDATYQMDETDGGLTVEPMSVAVSEPYSSHPPQAILQAMAFVNNQTEHCPQFDLGMLNNDPNFGNFFGQTGPQIDLGMLNFDQNSSDLQLVDPNEVLSQLFGDMGSNAQ